jgi:hypothetical protein
MKWPLVIVLVMSSVLATRAAQDSPQPVATTKQVMLDIILPASNSLLLLVNRGGPGDDKEWAEARRSALILAESGNLLMIRNRAAGWTADAKELTDAGAAAYRAVEAKDAKALASVSDRIDASCTTCHKHSRRNVFPGATQH